MSLVVINFAHPMSRAQRERISFLTNQPVERVIDTWAQFDHARPFAEQVRDLADRVGLTPEEWQTLPLLVNPPSLHTAAVALLAELHGRMGYFPGILRLRPVARSNPPQFEVAEILNLNQIRDAARGTRR